MIETNSRSHKWRLKAAVAALFLMSGVPAMAPAYAAQADIDLLKSYVGKWKGRGVTNAAGGDETIVCRMDITDAAHTKINYNGRCTLAGANVSLHGTVGFIAAKNRFEAVMSSNTAFQGVAVGKRRGKGIKFDLRERNPDTGAEFVINADMALQKDKIQVKFTLTEVATKRKIVASVPFKK